MVILRHAKETTEWEDIRIGQRVFKGGFLRVII